MHILAVLHKIVSICAAPLDSVALCACLDGGHIYGYVC